MSYIANQYNYATPLSSTSGLTDASLHIADLRYFTLHSNSLDGSYVPIDGDVGLWGNTLSESSGALLEPFIITVTESLDIHTFRLVGSESSYPVAFTVSFYYNSNLIYTITETANSDAAYVYNLPSVLSITSYKVHITKISSPNSVARVYKTFVSNYILRNFTDKVSLKESKRLTMTVYLRGTDTCTMHLTERSSPAITARSKDNIAAIVSVSTDLESTTRATDVVMVAANEPTCDIHNSVKVSNKLPITPKYSTAIHNTIDKTTDILKPLLTGLAKPCILTASFDSIVSKLSDACLSSGLTNIHSIMKSPERRIYGKVTVTYTDPLTEYSTPSVSVSSEAYNSMKAQVVDGIANVDSLFFVLYENDLSGRYSPISAASQVGWTSGAISDSDGFFAEPPYLLLDFSSRPISECTIYFDDTHGSVAEDFTVEFSCESGTTVASHITGNTSSIVNVEVPALLVDVAAIKITVTRTSKAHFPVVILDVPIVSTFTYAGYQDDSDLISIHLLEELTYNDSVEALGGVSANEITVVLDNSNKYFNMNSTTSPVARHLRRNRKIEPYLGVEIISGEVEWYRLGIFWSYKWDIPYDELTASAIGFDTLGLLDTTVFTNHTVQVNKSIGELTEYILTDAKNHFGTLEWIIDEALYDVIIPYAWFDLKSHTNALRKLSLAYPIHIYCNRQGAICVTPQKLHLDYYYDTWSDSTNVIKKSYSSLYTVVPNIINVKIISPKVLNDHELVNDNLIYDVDGNSTVTLNFGSPYLSDLSIIVDKDPDVSYTYTTYSWGIEIAFTGIGTVRSIVCKGTALDTSNTTVYTARDEESIRLNGALAREVSADFIQTRSMAVAITERLIELGANDIYDAEVEYRGDIALTINDPILLLDGIAPDNRYNIKRHQLHWDGALTGTADLNT